MPIDFIPGVVLATVSLVAVAMIFLFRSRLYRELTNARGQERTEQLLNDMQDEFQKTQSSLHQRMAAMQTSLEVRELEPTTAGGSGTGGYIIIDLPEGERSLFHDLLKGFEDYARLKGYRVHFSADSSIPNKIGFKFTLGEEGVSISTDQVRRDIQEYIRKVESGEPLDDLPVVLSEEEHSLVLTKMKNRINFLQHSFNLEKFAKEFYEDLFDKIRTSSAGIMQAPSVLVQTGGTLHSRSYQAIGSPQAAVGEQSAVIGASIDSSIRIEDSFQQRGVQIDAVTRLVKLLYEDTEIEGPAKEEAVANLHKIEGELTEEGQPDKSKIAKWFSNVTNAFRTVKLGEDTVRGARDLFDSFNLGSLLAGIPGIG